MLSPLTAKVVQTIRSFVPLGRRMQCNGDNKTVATTCRGKRKFKMVSEQAQLLHWNVNAEETRFVPFYFQKQNFKTFPGLFHTSKSNTQTNLFQLLHLPICLLFNVLYDEFTDFQDFPQLPIIFKGFSVLEKS